MAYSAAPSVGAAPETVDVAVDPNGGRIPHSGRLTGLPAVSLGRRLRNIGKRFWRTPLDSAATTGRGVMLFASVLRFSVTDAMSFRLPVGEVVVQAWTLYKVTALPAIMMRFRSARWLRCRLRD